MTIIYTIYNEKYSFCVLMHPIGQNGRAVYKKTWWPWRCSDKGNVGKVSNVSAVGDGSDKGNVVNW